MRSLRWFTAALCCGSSAALAAQVRISQPVRPQAQVRTQVAAADVPTCAAGRCLLQYYGGKVISNVKVYQVNWTAGGQPSMAGLQRHHQQQLIHWLNEYSTNIPVQAGTRLGAQGTGQLVGRGVFGAPSPSPLRRRTRAARSNGCRRRHQQLLLARRGAARGGRLHPGRADRRRAAEADRRRTAAAGGRERALLRLLPRQHHHQPAGPQRLRRGRVLRLPQHLSRSGLEPQRLLRGHAQPRKRQRVRPRLRRSGPDHGIRQGQRNLVARAGGSDHRPGGRRRRFRQFPARLVRREQRRDRRHLRSRRARHRRRISWWRSSSPTG